MCVYLYIYIYIYIYIYMYIYIYIYKSLNETAKSNFTDTLTQWNPDFSNTPAINTFPFRRYVEAFSDTEFTCMQ